MSYDVIMSESSEVRSYTLGDLDTNCYLIWCPKTFETLIIDPADSGDFISQQILELQLTPVGIILTHGHFDHCLGLLELKLNFQIPIMIHQADTPLLAKAAGSAQHWLKRSVDPIPPADALIKDGDTLGFGNQTLQILHTPGHTPGSICLFDDHVVFSGDTWFKDGVGSTDHAYSSPRQLHKSLELLRAQADGRLVYPGHGEAFFG